MPKNNKPKPTVKVYSAELERSFTILRSVFYPFYMNHLVSIGQRFDPPFFSPVRQEFIEQLWTSDFVPPDTTTRIRTRVRKTVHNLFQTPVFEATTKYEKRSSDLNFEARIELNTPISPEEYNLILSCFPGKPTHKTRSYFYDYGSCITRNNYGSDITKTDKSFYPLYSVDYYHHTDPMADYVTLEIEFPNKSTAEQYQPPKWLTELLQESKKQEENRGEKHGE